MLPRIDISVLTALAGSLRNLPESVIRQATGANIWFTEENIRRAARAIADTMLDESKILEWLEAYEDNGRKELNIGIVAAGNIPMVGFFDLLCVLVTGNGATLRLSSKDRVLMEYIVGVLHSGGCRIALSDDFSACDAVIATGSDNTNRYFRSEFEGKPSLLRGSRYSAAVLSGRETEAYLTGLSEDIFTHFGLGCRSVSLLYVPKGYDINALAAFLGRYAPSHPEYEGAYKSSRAIASMNGINFTDGGRFIIKPHDGTIAPVAVVNYVEYNSVVDVENTLELIDDKIQCVVSDIINHNRRVGFGQAQNPGLSDYPDGKDVIKFLLSL